MSNHKRIFMRKTMSGLAHRDSDSYSPSRRRLLSLALLLSSLLVPHLCMAQASSSSVTGVITDGTGAVIAGAKVTLQDVGTNVVRTVPSNNSGEYFFSNVPPARYTLQIVASGFSPESITAFDVAVAQAVTLNARLAVGNAKQSVTVTASGTEIEASTSQLGTVIDQTTVNDLPLNGRNFTQLLQLTPGVSPISMGQNSGGQYSEIVAPGAASTTYSFPAINGAGNRSTEYLIDGMNDNSAFYNTYAIPPIIDTIAQFKINSHNDSLYGGVTGGVVNVITKSGTNDYHGTVWEYIRSSSFDAHPFFSAPPSYHLNTNGIQVNGPVRIPWLYNGRDKTFFEAGLEASQFSIAGSSYYLAPTPAQLNGDFSSATTGVTKQGTCVAGDTKAEPYPCQLYDPTIANNAAVPSRPAYLGNQIPSSEINQYSLAVVKAIFSTPPIVIPGIAPTVDNGQIVDPTRQKTYNWLVRIDEHLGTPDSIFFRYSSYSNNLVAPSTLPTLISTTNTPAQQYGIGWTHIFNPTTLMQVQYGRAHVGQTAATLFQNRQLWQVFGCAASLCDSFLSGIANLPQIRVTGGFSGGEQDNQAKSVSSDHGWSGSVIKTIGNHLLQAGGGWDELNYTNTVAQPTYAFTGGATSNFAGNPGSAPGLSTAQISAQSGFGLADFLLDEPNQATKRNIEITERAGGIGGAYIQDSWKFNSKLTLNYGLRYDRSVIPAYGTPGSVGQNGSIETGDMDFNTGQYIIQQLPPLCSVLGHAPCLPSATLPANVRVAIGGKILHGTKTDFGPHVGFAYLAHKDLSIRGGFGISYDNWSAVIQLTQNYQGSWPDTGTLQVNNLNTPGTPYTSAQNPFLANAGNLPAASPFGSSNVNYMVDPNWKDPYAEQYNFGIEQQFGAGNVFSLNYVGSETHRLDVGGYYNTGTPAVAASFAARGTNTGQPYPYAVPQKSWDHSAASSSYNALQASLKGRWASGLDYLVSYTWSQNLDEGSDGLFGQEGGVPEDPYNPRGSRGPAGYSIPQELAASVVYELPFGPGRALQTGRRWVDYLIGDWHLNGIFIGHSGKDFSVLAAGDIANTGNGSTYERANLVGNPYQSGPIAANPSCTPPAGPTRTRYQWFNPCAFTTPAIGTLGNSSRNFLREQTFYNLDTSINRMFPVKDSLKLKLEFQAFNALNHPVLGGPGTTVTSPSSLGVVTATQFGNSQRILQGALKVEF